ncbi:hypothetical protein [Corynebacterium neomassiliense]|uniref:hypothetical protein n=1 Tax=Corynebacterium neomassiliense TaxID=2079482 RepID=UPI00102F6183|nr:hypothetical protein [Corynebacterium neomassiliense]
MTEQPCLPNLEPLERVLHNAGADWNRAAENAMRELEHRGHPFTADDVRTLIPDGVEPAHPNAWGAIFNAHRRAGLITATGRVHNSSHPKRNAGTQRLWQPTTNTQAA